MTSPALASESPGVQQWTDADLIGSYQELQASGTLTAAIHSPKRPSEAQNVAFLEGLAWYAAGSPDRPGLLTQAQLDATINAQASAYADLLAEKVSKGVDNDYPRTRTWKVVQKLMLLHDDMQRSPRPEGYPFPAMTLAGGEHDAWEREHTLRSPEDFRSRVCETSHQKPVLVKFGNTNCTQCMLFEMVGSIRELAERPEHQDIAVYKVWYGMRPDASFAGRLRDPERLDELAAAEGIKSSPTFVVYRNGRRYPCAESFPDASGADPAIDACLAQPLVDGPVAPGCSENVTVASAS